MDNDGEEDEPIDRWYYVSKRRVGMVGWTY